MWAVLDLNPRVAPGILAGVCEPAVSRGYEDEQAGAGVPRRPSVTEQVHTVHLLCVLLMKLNS